MTKNWTKEDFKKEISFLKQTKEEIETKAQKEVKQINEEINRLIDLCINL